MPPVLPLMNWAAAGKWLELLKEIAPHVTRAGILRDAAVTIGVAQFGAIQTAVPSLGVDVTPIGVRGPDDIERAIAGFTRSSNDGLIVTGSALTAVHHRLIVTVAGRHKLPAVYFQRFFVTAGGLISYGPDYIDQFRRAAGYVDRILNAEKPAALPVQAPTKYVGNQSKDCEDPRPRGARDRARPRRRGDRIGALFAASAHGGFWHEAAFAAAQINQSQRDGHRPAIH